MYNIYAGQAGRYVLLFDITEIPNNVGGYFFFFSIYDEQYTHNVVTIIIHRIPFGLFTRTDLSGVLQTLRAR